MASPKADLVVVVKRQDGTVETHHVMARLTQPTQPESEPEPRPKPPKESSS